MTTNLNSTCDACRDGCPDCGDLGATVLGSNYCHDCYSRRNHPCNTAFIEYEHEHTGRCGWADDGSRICNDVCTCDDGETCDHCARYWADKAEEDIWCGVPEPHCTCDGSGRMCDYCAEEYAEPCRGCGVSSQLWTDNTYCRSCYVDRYGDEFPPRPSSVSSLPPLPPSPPHHKSLESMRDEIAEIEERLQTNMTKGQKDDWIWLLQNRRADLAEAEKEMWAGYDQDDLNKLDLQNRRGF